VQSWWQQDVVVAGKWPLMLCFVTFVASARASRSYWTNSR
jgi:hypothetical protein